MARQHPGGLRTNLRSPQPRASVETFLDIISNHGGRQVDHSIAALDALVRIREAVGPEPTLLMDSGVRSGADLFLALALGANACLLGRPHVYGLALDGAAGVSAVIDNVVAELDLTMGLVGVSSIEEITADLLVG